MLKLNKKKNNYPVRNLDRSWVAAMSQRLQQKSQRCRCDPPRDPNCCRGDVAAMYHRDVATKSPGDVAATSRVRHKVPSKSLLRHRSDVASLVKKSPRRCCRDVAQVTTIAIAHVEKHSVMHARMYFITRIKSCSRIWLKAQ